MSSNTSASSASSPPNEVDYVNGLPAVTEDIRELVRSSMGCNMGMVMMEGLITAHEELDRIRKERKPSSDFFRIYRKEVTAENTTVTKILAPSISYFKHRERLQTLFSTAYPTKGELDIVQECNVYLMRHEGNIIAFMVTQPLSTLKDDPLYKEVVTAEYDNEDTLFVRWMCRDSRFSGVFQRFLSEIHCPVLCLVDVLSDPLIKHMKSFGFESVKTFREEQGEESVIMFREMSMYTFLHVHCKNDENHVESVVVYTVKNDDDVYELLQRLGNKNNYETMRLPADDGQLKIKCKRLVQFLLGELEPNDKRKDVTMLFSQYAWADGLLTRANNKKKYTDDKDIEECLNKYDYQHDVDEPSDEPSGAYYDIRPAFA